MMEAARSKEVPVRTSSMPAPARFAAAWPLAAVVALLVAVPSGRSDPGSDELLDRALGDLEEVARTPVTLEARGLEAVEAVRRLAEQSPLPLIADWAALEEVGTWDDRPVSVDIRRGGLESALDALVAQLGDEYAPVTWEWHAGGLVITTVDASAAMGLTEVYDVHDLLAADETIRSIEAASPAPRPSEPPAEAEETAGEAAPIGDLDPFERTPAESLLHLIVQHVDPEAWIDFGGDRARVSTHGDLVIVTAPPRLHGRLQSALARLRATNPSMVDLEFAVVDLPADAWEVLERRHDRGTAALARAILRDESAAVLWRARRLPASLETPLRVEVANGPIEIAVACTARQADDGSTELALDVRTAHGTDVRSVTTRVPAPRFRGSVIVELPSATPSDDLRLLVAVPRLR